MNYDEKTLQYMTLLEAEMGLLLAPERGIESRVLDAMRYSLLGGGKRVRGILTLAACEMVQGDYVAAQPAAAAIEMVHAYSLIHDDLPAMDDDDMRRGKPACHIAYNEATAILAGDALQTLAFAALARIQPAGAAIECVSILANASGHNGMVLGQELDLAAEGNVKLTPAQLTRIHHYKTAALIRAAVLMGGVVGQANQAQRNALDEYATLLGLVFQLVDDILDTTASEQELGKPIGSDAVQEKVTGASLYGVERARQLAAEQTAKAIAVLSSNFKHAEYLIEFTKRMLTRTK